jgi:hypothetical protein
MAYKLNDIVTYLETTLGSNAHLNGKVTWTYKDDTPPTFKDYGVHIYLGLDEPKEIEYRKIGPIAQENWRINLDFIYNKSPLPRVALSDSLGLSYWENQLTALLFHKNNNGTFKDSWYDSRGHEDLADSHVIRGLFNCQLENVYGTN